MNNRYSLSSLLHEYIDIFRGIHREQSNALITYVNAQREMNNSLSDLLLRYLEIERQSRNLANQPINNPFGRSVGRIPPPPVFNFSDPTNNTRAPSQSPISNTGIDFSWPSNNTNPISRTQPTLRSFNSFRPRDAPISDFNSGRRRGRGRGRRAPRIRATTNVTTTTIPRDIFQNFINNTLNMGNIPQPLSAEDISSNVTNLIYSELDEDNTQTICPFTQDNFQPSDEISRINPCGHIFTRSHLHRYLSNFDYRCPVCRRDLRRENDVENPSPVNNLLDLSSNLTILPVTQNNRQTRNIINNAVESVTNALMSNITNQINSDPSRNSFIAEYSFLLPQVNNTINTTNVTPNFTSTADSDIHDYLGLPPRNNSTQTLPPLPEDTDTDMPELEEDDDDL
tara:strand:- start:561 stop:1751 length:1191 start_codon:yes stop_codon:yes gene_type:complete